MKNLLLIMVAAICCTYASAQRYTDMQISLNNPVTGDTITVAQSFNISAEIKNNGPDTIYSGDTLHFQLSFNGSYIGFSDGNGGFIPYILLTGKDVLPGDSSRISFSFTLNNGWDTGGTDICVKVIALTSNDTVGYNDSSCSNVTVFDPTVSVKSLDNTNAMKVYPNPSFGDVHFEIPVNTNSDVQVLVSDLTGRIVLRELNEHVQGTKHNVTVDKGRLQPGIYVYTVSTRDNIWRGKLEVH